MSLRIVLMRPRNAENLGAIARAMKNFGLSDWALVSPNPKLLESPDARQLAVRSGDILEKVQVFSTLAEAVKDCVWVVGTTMRHLPGMVRVSPREVARKAQQKNGRVALVFGDERSGLPNDDLVQCHALSGIPSDDAQPSLNLAQAVLVYCYEARLAALESKHLEQAPKAPLAQDEAVRGLVGQLEEMLKHSGFLSPVRNVAVVKELAAPWLRGALTEKESRLWNGVLRNLNKRLPLRFGSKF